MKRQHYTNEEKEKMLFRYASEQTDVQDLLQEAGIPKSTFNQWLANMTHSTTVRAKMITAQEISVISNYAIIFQSIHSLRQRSHRKLLWISEKRGTLPTSLPFRT